MPDLFDWEDDPDLASGSRVRAAVLGFLVTFLISFLISYLLFS